MIVNYAQQLKEENQTFVTKISTLEQEIKTLKNMNNTLLQTNINIGNDESVTLLYAQLRDKWGHLMEEHEEIRNKYRELLNKHLNLEGFSSKKIEYLEAQLKAKTEKYENTVADYKKELEHENKLLIQSDSKLTELQFSYDQTFTYYNERNDRLNQENADLRSKMSALEKLIGDSKAEITILKRQKDQQLMKSTDLEDRIYFYENQLKTAQDKLQCRQSDIPTYGKVKKSNRGPQNRFKRPAANDLAKPFDTLNVHNSVSPVPNGSSSDTINETNVSSRTSNNHFDSINLPSATAPNNEMSCNVNLNVKVSKTVTAQPRKLFITSTFNVDDNLQSHEQMNPPQSSSTDATEGVGKGQTAHNPDEYLGMQLVKEMYSNVGCKKRSRKLFDPDDL